MNTYDVGYLFYMLLVAGTVIFVTYENNQLLARNAELEDIIIYKERYVLANPNETQLKLYGMASSDKWYCVWTANQTSSEIYETDAHERLHILIAKNEPYLNITYREHFCEG